MSNEFKIITTNSETKRMATVDNVKILCIKIIDTRPYPVRRTSPSTRSKNIRVAAQCYMAVIDLSIFDILH